MKSEVYNNDSIKFLEEYKGERIHLVVTDPPYELPSWAGGGFMNEKTVRPDWINEMNVDNLSKSYKIDYYADLLYKAQGGKINAYFFVTSCRYHSISRPMLNDTNASLTF